MANIPLFNQAQTKTTYDTLLNQSLQASISDNGFVIPNRSTTDIADLVTKMPNGAMWLDITTNELKMKDASGNLRIIPFL